MVDAVGLACFVLELAVAARRAAGCVGGGGGAASRASDTPVRARAVGLGLICAWVAGLLRVAEWLARVELVLSAWADHAFSSIHSARELASLTAFTCLIKPDVFSWNTTQAVPFCSSTTPLPSACSAAPAINALVAAPLVLELAPGTDTAKCTCIGGLVQTSTATRAIHPTLLALVLA
jgi:hypothetical protein